MQSSLRLARVPTPAWLLLFIVTALVVAVAFAVAGRRPPLPPPFGLARTGVIAFDHGGDVFVAAADGSDVRAIATGPASDSNPVFSPDGTHVAFWRTEGDTLSVVTAMADGSGPVTVPLPRGAKRSQQNLAFLTWRPDSRRIAFSLSLPTEERPGIWVVDAAGGTPTRLTDPGHWAADPTWSPDGKQIAYHGEQLSDTENGVWLMSADGSDSRQLSRAFGSGAAFMLPQWQPGGDLIAYYAGDDGAHEVYVVRADGNGELDVSNDATDDEYWPSWSPDGTRLAFQRAVYRPTGELANQLVTVDPDGRFNSVTDPAASAHLSPDILLDGLTPMWSPDGTHVAGLLGSQARGDFAVAIVSLADDSIVQVPAEGNPGYVSWQRLAP